MTSFACLQDETSEIDKLVSKFRSLNPIRSPHGSPGPAQKDRAMPLFRPEQPRKILEPQEQPPQVYSGLCDQLKLCACICLAYKARCCCYILPRAEMMLLLLSPPHSIVLRTY